MIWEALSYIPTDVRPNFARLLAVVLGSGADPFTALAAVYRFTRGRERYAEIHKGLGNYFRQEVAEACR
jgi:hypothetical protein